MDEKKVTDLINRGNEFHDAGDFDEAINCYAEAANLDHENADIFHNWWEAISDLIENMQNMPLIERGQSELLIENACKKFRKAIPSDTQNVDILHYWGNTLGDLGFIKQNELLMYKACEKYAKALQLNPKNAGVLNSWGCTLYDLGVIKQDVSLMSTACEKYSQAMELDPKNSTIADNWESALSDYYNMEHDVSILLSAYENYDKVVSSDFKDAGFFYTWGIILLKDGIVRQSDSLMDEACKKFNEANNKSVQKNISILCSWGNALLNLYSIKQDSSLRSIADEKFKEAISIEPKNSSNIYCYWGYAFSKLFISKPNREFLEEARNKYREAARQKSCSACIFIRWGVMLLNLDNIKLNDSLSNQTLLNAEFAHFENISEKVNDPYVHFINGVLCLMLRNKKAEEYLRKSEKSILEFLGTLNEEDVKKIIKGRTFDLLLDSKASIDGAFFQKTIKDKDISDKNLKKYKEAYISSNRIISKLRVTLGDDEKVVAHYRRKTTVQKLLFDKNAVFRLNTLNNTNDPTEGETLLDYFYGKEKAPPKDMLNSEYNVFAACFNFNYDSLNQFRLYGKEMGKEGTGLSLVFGSSFFCKKANFGATPRIYSSEKKQGGPKFFSKDTRATSKEKASYIENCPDDGLILYCNYTTKEIGVAEENGGDPNNGLALYRCIYIDPDEKHVVTVGQKDEYLFYQEKNYTLSNSYKERIIKSIDSIRDIMDELKDLVNDNDLDKIVIGQLLINLRYLTKHVAFKEEQECRITKICQFNGSDIIRYDKDYEQVYIEYEPKVTKHAKFVCLGPKATNIELFQKILMEKCPKITCIRSRNPLA